MRHHIPSFPLITKNDGANRANLILEIVATLKEMPYEDILDERNRIVGDYYLAVLPDEALYPEEGQLLTQEEYARAVGG